MEGPGSQPSCSCHRAQQALGAQHSRGPQAIYKRNLAQNLHLSRQVLLLCRLGVQVWLQGEGMAE